MYNLDVCIVIISTIMFTLHLSLVPSRVHSYHVAVFQEHIDVHAQTQILHFQFRGDFEVSQNMRQHYFHDRHRVLLSYNRQSIICQLIVD